MIEIQEKRRRKMSIFDDKIAFNWLISIYDPNSRNEALLLLGKNRQKFPDLGKVIWNSPGMVTILLQEIIKVYPYLTGSKDHVLTSEISTRICNVLVLFQCIAFDEETRTDLINSEILSYLFPFLQCPQNTVLQEYATFKQLDVHDKILKSRPFEYLRLTALGVFGSFVRVDSSNVVEYLISTDLVPQCLIIMETCSELSRIVALFIFMRIVLNKKGLNYVVSSENRILSVLSVLKGMIYSLQLPKELQPNASNTNDQSNNGNNPPGRTFKNVLRCYLSLCDVKELRTIIKDKIPPEIFYVMCSKDNLTEPQKNTRLNIALENGFNIDTCQLLLHIKNEDPTVFKLQVQLLQLLGMPVAP